MLKTALLKMLTLKAGAVAVLAVGAGGVALAASTGALPNPLSPHSSPSAPDRGAGSDADDHGNATPSPSLVGLCTAFQAGAGADHGKALDSPAFQALIAAAGGKDKVDAFCTNLLATAPGHPTAHPSPQPGNGHPTGPPTTHPTETPSHPGP
jgi:hypothetical protein